MRTQWDNKVDMSHRDLWLMLIPVMINCVVIGMVIGMASVYWRRWQNSKQRNKYVYRHKRGIEEVESKIRKVCYTARTCRECSNLFFPFGTDSRICMDCQDI